MSSDEKVALYNENVESDGEQLVCRRERLVGTHFRRTACYTRAELEDMRRAAQDTLENRPGREGDPFRAVTNPPGRP